MVVGGGPLAQSKIESLHRAGAHVLVIAPEATAKIQKLAERGELRWRVRKFAAPDLRGACLAVAATNSPNVNEAVFLACRRAKVLCNVVDVPEHCDFFYPAVVRRDPLQIAISTGGASPALAARLRRELEQQFGPEYSRWLRVLARQRRKILESALPLKTKRALLHRMVSREEWEKFLAQRKARKAT